MDHMRRRVLSLLGVLSLFAVVGASSVTAGVTISETIPGNPPCDGTKIDPVTAGSHDLVGGGHIVITLGWDNGQVFSFNTEGTATVSSIMVKGGPNAILWSFNPPVTAWSGLHAPLNLKNPNGYWYGLSHLCIHSAKKDAPDPKK